MRKLIIAFAFILMTATNGMAQKMEEMTPDKASTYMKGKLNLNSNQTSKMKKLNKKYSSLFKGHEGNLSTNQRATKKKEYKKHVKNILTNEQYEEYQKLPYMNESNNNKQGCKKNCKKQTNKKRQNKRQHNNRSQRN